jgi:hypothetical protein
MADPFHRAEAWRSRAGQLRDLASRTRDPVVSISLAGMAEALEQHARKLEEMALKIRCAHRARFGSGVNAADLRRGGRRLSGAPVRGI